MTTDATVRQAFIFAASTGSSGRSLIDGDVMIDGVGVHWAASISNAIGSSNHWGDVTSIIKKKIDTAPPGRIGFAITEVDTQGIDGEILAVIFDSPSLARDQTIDLLFGAQAVTGGLFSVNLANPVDLGSPDFRIDMSLGISFGAQGDCAGGNQFNVIDVNSMRLTSTAGGEDDGICENGALLTVGGLDDTDADPVDPFAQNDRDPRQDDELYNLVPFVSTGDTAITVDTQNPSSDDNIFFAALVVSNKIELCDNGIDDDGDGLIDAEDGDCQPVSLIAFTQQNQIFVGRQVGRDAEAITPGCSSCSQPVLSPDGARVAYRSTDGGHDALHLYDRVSGSDSVLFSGLTNGFSFSPDGQRLVVAAITADPSNLSRMIAALVEITLDDPTDIGVLRRYPRSSMPPVDPVYSPDGSSLFFSRAGFIFVKDANTGSPRKLIKAAASQGLFAAARLPVPSRDVSTVYAGTSQAVVGQLLFRGSQAIAGTEPGGGDLYLADLSSARSGSFVAANIRAITHDSQSTRPTWSNDGTAVIYQDSESLVSMPLDATIARDIIDAAEWPSITSGDPDAVTPDSECDCECDCVTPCPDGQLCSDDCTCEPFEPQPPVEAATTCHIYCCDGYQAIFDAPEEDTCYSQALTRADCADHCQSDAMVYGGDDFWLGECSICCALCNNRQDYHEVASVACGDCTGAADQYCEQSNRGGLKDAKWGFCEP